MDEEKNFEDMGNEYSYPTNTSNNYYVDEGSYLVGFNCGWMLWFAIMISAKIPAPI